MDTVISSISVILIAASLLIFLYGSLSIYRTLKNKSSLMLFAGQLLFILTAIIAVIFETIVATYMEINDVGAAINYLIAVLNEVVPHLMLVISAIGLCGIAVYIQKQSNQGS